MHPTANEGLTFRISRTLSPCLPFDPEAALRANRVHGFDSRRRLHNLSVNAPGRAIGLTDG